MKLVICIEAEDLSELFAVGPKDLKEYFLPKWFGIKPSDVKACWFEEYQRDGKIISPADALVGSTAYHLRTHKDNIGGK
jgi:hypothetical protein